MGNDRRLTERPALRLARAIVVSTAILSGTFGTASANAAAAGHPGTRITVALFGDSVTQSVLVPNFMNEGLAPQLARAERGFGFVPGGVGLIPVAPFNWSFNSWVSYGTGPSPTNGWTTIGDGLSPGFDGPDGYSAVATSPLATASVKVDDPDVEVLFTSTQVHCLFGVSVAGSVWVLDTYRPGPITDTQSPIRLPPGAHKLTVHGPNCGFLSFNGIVVQRPVPAGENQIEVDNLGHAGKLPWIDFQPRVQQSLLLERYTISVFLYGYIAELFSPDVPKQYVNSILARAKIARADGGACVIVAPTPIDARPFAVALVAHLDRLAARRAGCTYTTVLTQLWSSWPSAENRGLLLVDGVHPTARGYALIAHALAPVIARVADHQLRHAPGVAG
ncbi:MAG: SGNH/GDSL hydrolase family protein [Solirubrobacteraceae bacterium]